jgi:hypothetical protein
MMRKSVGRVVGMTGGVGCDGRTGNVHPFFFGWEREENSSCTVTPKRRVWDSNRAHQWAYMPVWTVCPVVLPTKNPSNCAS